MSPVRVPRRRPMPTTPRGECSYCGGDAHAGRFRLRIVHPGRVHHVSVFVDCWWNPVVYVCPWCRPHRRRDTNWGEMVECPECYPVDPAWRTEVIMRRAGGEPPWEPGE